jgi:TackOD1 domain-containing protein
MLISRSERPAQAARGSQAEAEPLPFLALGDAPPLVPGMHCDARAGAPCAGIVLVGAVAPAALADALDAAPDPALPIVDLGANQALRSDVTGDPSDAALAANLHERLAPILNRLHAIPFRAAREDRAELTILRLAYSRSTSIEAKLDPTSRSLVEYPLLGRTNMYRSRLEGLATLELLRRQHFTRTHLCTRCDSARLHAFEACPGCGGADLFEAAIVHHYRCGWQEPEPCFVQDHALICPKCRRELRHYGVDYDKPGTVMVCRGCSQANSDPAVCFACLDCTHVMPAREARTLDWYHYDLTEEGLQALRAGRIPRFNFGAHLSGHPRAFALRDFRLLARECVRVARRYKRPFAIGTLSFSNASTLRQHHGPTKADQGFRRALDTIVEALRDSDFIGAEGGQSIFIGFPETTENDAHTILDRLSARIKEVTGLPIALAVAVAGENADELLLEDDRP